MCSAQAVQDVAGIRTVKILIKRLEACPLNKAQTLAFHGAKLCLNSRMNVANFKREPSNCRGVVADATLELGSEGRVVLSGGSWVEFRNIVIEGGHPLTTVLRGAGRPDGQCMHAWLQRSIGPQGAALPLNVHNTVSASPAVLPRYLPALRDGARNEFPL